MVGAIVDRSPAAIAASLAVVLLAGCPYGGSKLPPAAEPADAPAPVASWWERGDAVCPTLDLPYDPTSGRPPGAGIEKGSIQETSTAGERTVACEVRGVKHGPATEWQADGSVSSGNYERGERTGRWVTYSASGGPVRVGSYERGAATGVWTTYRADGSIESVGRVAGGTPTGRWTYYRDGEPERFKLFEGGRVTGGGGYIGGRAKKTTKLCLVGGSWPYCSSILFADIGPRLQMLPTPAEGEDPRTSGSIEGGLILNLDRRQGAGASVGWIWSDPVADFVVRLRYRYWPAFPVALEVAPSLYRGDAGTHAGVGLNVSLIDMIAIGIEGKRDPGGDFTALFNLRISFVAIGTAAAVALRIGAAGAR